MPYLNLDNETKEKILNYLDAQIEKSEAGADPIIMSMGTAYWAVKQFIEVNTEEAG